MFGDSRGVCSWKAHVPKNKADGNSVHCVNGNNAFKACHLYGPLDYYFLCCDEPNDRMNKSSFYHNREDKNNMKRP